MAEYQFKGTIQLTGVLFYIEADSLEEAKAKAKRAEYDDCDESCAEAYDWEIIPDTGKMTEE